MRSKTVAWIGIFLLLLCSSCAPGLERSILEPLTLLNLLRRFFSASSGATATATLGGKITGYTNSGLVLDLNSGTSVTIPANATSYTIPNVQTGNYSLSVQANPSGLTCTFASNQARITGNTSDSNISALDITCISTSGLVYSGNPFTFTQNVAITPITPTVTGTGAITGCTSSPALPTGLSIDNTTCAISGTPTVVVGGSSYTITATTSSGNITVAIIIAIPGLLRQYAFTGGSYLDQSSANNLVPVIAPTLVIGKDGETSGATYFDGTTQYFNAPLTGLPQGASQRTLCAWVSPAQYPNSGNSITILSFGTASSGQSFGLNLFNNSGTQQVVLSASGDDVATNYTLPLNTWSHLCATYDGTTARIFINGNQVATAAKSYNTGSTFFSIGSNSGSQYYRGKIDDVRIYSGVQTATQIKLFAIQVPSGLVAYYPLDGDLNDYSGNGANGSIVGTVTPASDRFGNPNSAYASLAADNNYIRAPDTNLPTGASARTICAWYRSDNIGPGVVPLGYGNFPPSPGQNFALWLENPGPTSTTRSWIGGGGDINGVFNGNNMLPNLVWRHYCITNNGTNTEILVNGRQIPGSGPQALGTVSSGFLYMGSWVTGRGDAGSIDEVRVYNRELLLNEVQALSGNHPFQLSAWNTNPGTSNLKIQLDVDTLVNQTNGSPVTPWNDTSGNANHVSAGTAPTYFRSVINGKPSVTFASASSQFLQRASTTGTFGTPFTWIVVTQPNSFPSTGVELGIASISSIANCTTTNDKMIGIVQNSSNWTAGGCGVVLGTAPSLTAGTPYILTYTYNTGGGNSNSFNNGLNVLTGGGLGAVNLGDNALNIGRRILTGSGSEYDGSISEVYYFNTVLSAAVRNRLNCYFSSKYNIALDSSVICP